MIDSYNKLTLRKWGELAALDRRTFEDDLSRQVAVLAILSGKSERDILALPLPEYAALVPVADFLFDIPQPSGIAAGGLRTLRLGGWELVPTTDLRKLSTAQYVDFQTMLTGGAPIEELLSCFLVPRGRTYCEGYEVEDLHALLADRLTVPDALALKAFFLRKCESSMRDILTSCRVAMMAAPRKVRKAWKKVLTTSTSGGDGSTRSASSAT